MRDIIINTFFETHLIFVCFDQITSKHMFPLKNVIKSVMLIEEKES